MQNKIQKKLKAVQNKKFMDLMFRKWDYLSKKMADRIGWLPPLASPNFLNIEPANVCNLKCRLCPTGNDILGREKGFMSLELFSDILKGWDGKNTRLDFSGFGEPFLNKNFPEMLQLSKERGFKVGISTNGNLMTPELSAKLVEFGVDNVLVAVDGATMESYDWYRRGGDFNRVVSNIRELVLAKQKINSAKPTVHLQFVVMKRNEHEIELIKKIAADLGVDALFLKTCGFYQYIGMSFEDFKKDYLPTDKKYHRLESEEKALPGFVCPWMNHGAMILWDGRISACCYDPYGEVILGQVGKKNTFLDQWRKSPVYKKFRSNAIKGLYPYKVCARCPVKFRLSKGEYVERVI